MSRKEKLPNELLEEYIAVYLGKGKNNVDNQDELEVRFATKHYNTLSNTLIACVLNS